MKLLVFSDIHGNAYALNALLEMLPRLEYDRIVFLGDIFGYYYGQEKCFELLRRFPTLIWLQGNHDAYAVKAYADNSIIKELIISYGHSYEKLRSRFSFWQMEFLAALPSSLDLDLGGKRMGFFHGRPADPLEGRIYPDTKLESTEFQSYELVFLGHTHCKMDRWVENIHVISPGSLGQPRDGKGYGFLIFDTDIGNCNFINLEIDGKVLYRDVMEKDASLKKLFEVLAREDGNGNRI